MTTTGEENYLRSSLLLLKGGTFTARKVVIREEQKEIRKSGRDLDDLLMDNKGRLEHEFRNYKHRQKLFPADGKTKFEDWDISLLTGVLQVVFRSTLSEKERKAVRSIKHQRNDVYAHRATADLSADNYSDVCDELKEALRNLMSEFSGEIKTECEDIIDSCLNGPIDIKSHIEHLKRVSDTDNMFRTILEKIDKNGKETMENIKEVVGQQHVSLKKDIAEDISNSQDVICRTVRDTQLTKADFTTLVRDAVQQALQEQRSTRKVKVVDSELEVSGKDVDKPNIDLAEQMIKTVTNEAIRRTQTSEELVDIREAIQEILDEIASRTGVKAREADIGCVVIKFSYETYEQLLKLLVYLDSEDIKLRLAKLAALLSHHLQTKEELHLSTSLSIKCLQNILDELEKESRSEYKRTIQIPIQFESVEGMAHVWNYFENGGATNSLNKLSEALSAKLGTKITLTSSLNVDQFKSALDDFGSENTSTRLTDQLQVDDTTQSVDEGSQEGESQGKKSSSEVASEVNEADPKVVRNAQKHHNGKCEVCKQDGQLILCATCPRRYHASCVKPESKEIAVDHWFCPICITWRNYIEDIERFRTAQKQKQPKGKLPKEILEMDSRSIDIYRKALKEGEYRAHHIRVMVVGHYGVGKTTLTKRLFGDEVDIGKRESTDGIDVHVKRCKVSMNDGTWQVHGKQTDKDKARKAIFHQLAKLFKKDDQEVTQLQPSKEMNSMLDIEDTLHESAKPQEETRSQTCSCMDVDKAQEQKTTVEYPEDRRKTETKHSDTVMKESAEIIYSRPQSTDDIEEPAVESVDEDYAQSLRHLKKFIENVQVDKEHLGTCDLSLWDFAGQNVFYATHQVFFSRRAVYLLVTNISKHIDDTVDDDPWHTDCRGEAKCRIAEYIDFWLNSIHEFCSNEEDNGPPIILVGTFADQLKKDISPDDAFSKLREFLVDKVASCHLTTEDFLIDNTTEDGTIQSLKKHIFDEASKQGYWGEDIPAKWVTLEDNLIRLKEENLKVLDKDKLKELNKTLPAPIESDKELELFLQFHHEMGNIIYFSKDDLTNYILLDPQWLIDAFKSVITAKSFCIKQQKIKKEWMDFDRTALLKPVLIDAVWGKHENSGFSQYRDLLLTYMEILGLMARPLQQDDHSAKVEDWYFVPCMLKEPPPEKETCYCDSRDCKSTSKLCYTTAAEPEERFLPATMFNKVLAACLQKWPLSKQNRKSMIFCGGAIFSLKENHFLYIFFYEHVIQIWITRSSSDGQFPNISLCTETKHNIEYILKTNIRMHSKIIAFVKCPRAVLYSNENMIPLEHTEDDSTEEIVCYCQDIKHVVRYCDLTKYWSCVQDSNNSSEFESDQTTLTEKDFSKIANRIGKEYLQLGRKLGIREAKLDHIQLDKSTTQDRIVAMLCEWKKQMADKATASELRRALEAIGIDASAVLQ